MAQRLADVTVRYMTVMAKPVGAGAVIVTVIGFETGELLVLPFAFTTFATTP